MLISHNREEEVSDGGEQAADLLEEVTVTERLCWGSGWGI